jgi:hypothetical protein
MYKDCVLEKIFFFFTVCIQNPLFIQEIESLTSLTICTFVQIFLPKFYLINKSNLNYNQSFELIV